jgi:hypothetical protein
MHHHTQSFVVALNPLSCPLPPCPAAHRHETKVFNMTRGKSLEIKVRGGARHACGAPLPYVPDVMLWPP